MYGRSHDNEQKTYYGRNAIPPWQVKGKMAAHTWTVSPLANQTEIDIALNRPEIGRIEIKDCRHGHETEFITIFDEDRDQRPLRELTK